MLDILVSMILIATELVLSVFHTKKEDLKRTKYNKT